VVAAVLAWGALHTINNHTCRKSNPEAKVYQHVFVGKMIMRTVG
jgi:hypothetical protein